MDLQTMYCVGSLIAGFVSVAAFIWGFNTMERQKDSKWKEEWKQRIENLDRQTQNVSG
jgi:hypothetical protein